MRGRSVGFRKIEMLYKLSPKISIEFCCISVLFIVGLLIRLYRLSVPSLWWDEITTAQWANHSYLGTLSLLRHWEFPPFYYIILNGWVHLLGNGEWTLRFPSVIFSSLTIIIIYKLGKELFSKDVGLIAASLLAFSPFALNYAQDAKMYALFWLLAAGSFLSFFRFLNRHTDSAYRDYIIISILCCYTMYTGFLLLMTQSLIYLITVTRARWKQWFTGQLLIVSFCAPWVIYFLCSQHTSWSLRWPGVPFDYVKFFLIAFLQIIGGCVDGWGKINCFLYAFLIVYFLIGTVSYKNKKPSISFPENSYYLLLWIIVPIFIYFLSDYFFIRAQLHERYIGFLQVPIILLVSRQINNLNSLTKKIVVLGMVIIGMNNTYLYFKYNLKHTDGDWRTTAEELTQDLGRDDIVLSFIDIPDFKYYYKGDTRRFFMIPGMISSEFIGPVARSSLAGIESIRGTILDPNNKGGVWEDISSTQVCLRPNTFLKRDDIQEIAKGDADKIYSILIQAYLMKSGINKQHFHSIFVLYKSQMAPEINLNGFFVDYKVSNFGMGFLHFKRS